MGEGFSHVSSLDVEIAVWLLVAVPDGWSILAEERSSKPAALHLGHVPHESEKRKGRRLHCAKPELIGTEPRALHLERRSVKIEPGDEHLSLRRDARRHHSFHQIHLRDQGGAPRAL